MFVICFTSQWMERTKHGFFVFPPKKTLIWRRHCSIDQSCCSMTSKQFLESSSGMKFVYPSARLANQKPGAFVSVSYTNQIALFPFLCCFCSVRAFSFQGHTKIALFGINATSDISKLLYVISRAVRRVKFETILKYYECIYAKYHVQIMLLFVYTTTQKRFLIFTCRYFNLS